MRPITSLRTLGLAFASAFTLCAASAQAQTAPAPAPSAPAAAPAPAPAPAPAAAAPAPAAAEPAPAAPAAAEPAPAVAAPGAIEPPPVAPPVEEETFPAAWFRIDSDGLGLQLWAGATHMLSDSVGIASDVYINATGSAGAASPFYGEFDLGPSFLLGPMVATPMLGLQFDWANRRAAALVPQFYLTGGPDPVYMELWLQNYEYGAFDGSGVTAAGGGNTLYARYFIDYKFGKYFGVGPQAELTLGLNSKSQNADGEALLSLPVGGNVMLSSYGKNNVMFLFLGYETQDTPNDAHVAGRFTFVHNF